MKTITMPIEEYQADLEKERLAGYSQGFYDAEEIVKDGDITYSFKRTKESLGFLHSLNKHYQKKVSNG